MCHFFKLTPPYVDSDGLCVSYQNDTSLYVDSDGLCVSFQNDTSLYVDSDGLCVSFQNVTHKPSESTYKEMSV
jgi:hypothetical protein